MVVEGVCALHRSLRDAYAVRVWVEAPYDSGSSAALRGTGGGAKDLDRRLDAVGGPVCQGDDPLGCAQLVVDGSEPLGGIALTGRQRRFSLPSARNAGCSPSAAGPRRVAPPSSSPPGSPPAPRTT